MIHRFFLLILLILPISCATIDINSKPTNIKKMSSKSYCYLSAKNIILAGKYFRFKLVKKINYSNDSIVLSGKFTANTYLDFIDKDMPAKLVSMKMIVRFLGSDHSTVVYSEEHNLQYEPDKMPSIFSNIPVSFTMPFRPGYVFVEIESIARVVILPESDTKKVDDNIANNTIHRGLAGAGSLGFPYFGVELSFAKS
jgi:hypothetical protein